MPKIRTRICHYCQQRIHRTRGHHKNCVSEEAKDNA